MKRLPSESEESSYECSEEEKPKTSKKFVCKECKKRFSSRQCLKEHSYKHSNQKPYCCPICKVQFRHASQFTLHKQSHKTSYQPFWPVLAELEKKHLKTLGLNCFTYDEILLPKISGPQPGVLPLMSSLQESD